MYKQNDEQTLMNTKVTPSEHEPKSLHLCQLTSWHTTQGLFVLALHLILTIIFSVIVNISCNLSI